MVQGTRQCQGAELTSPPKKCFHHDYKHTSILSQSLERLARGGGIFVSCTNNLLTLKAISPLNRQDGSVVKVLAAKPENMNSIPKTYLVGESYDSRAFTHAHMFTCKHLCTYKFFFLKKKKPLLCQACNPSYQEAEAGGL